MGNYFIAVGASVLKRFGVATRTTFVAGFTMARGAKIAGRLFESLASSQKARSQDTTMEVQAPPQQLENGKKDPQ